ncbi:putative mitochondrial 54s ribosomal protein img1 [Phaeomoniella chlamydospora]|uniref:Putative mitochondrial 54s ribosomal protein img1 n=1 Tax=Phaeomoniella chlamydospora TaxID=158046 RepID=A0A0G2G3F9_PHACM|nr:putative mitochondrial 54s ribosomal protein img1 [Phaeomoniella chlamydospora]
MRKAKLLLPENLEPQFFDQLPARLRPDIVEKKLRILPPKPAIKFICPDPVAHIQASQMSLLDPTGVRAKMFDYKNREGAKVGDILHTTFKSGEPLSGVILSIKSRRQDTSVLVRSNLTKVGTEMSIKVFSPNVANVTLLKHDLDGLFLDESDRRMQDTDQSPYQQQLSVSVGVLAKVESGLLDGMSQCPQGYEDFAVFLDNTTPVYTLKCADIKFRTWFISSATQFIKRHGSLPAADLPMEISPAADLLKDIISAWENAFKEGLVVNKDPTINKHIIDLQRNHESFIETIEEQKKELELKGKELTDVKSHYHAKLSMWYQDDQEKDGKIGGLKYEVTRLRKELERSKAEKTSLNIRGEVTA